MRAPARANQGGQGKEDLRSVAVVKQGPNQRHQGDRDHRADQRDERDGLGRLAGIQSLRLHDGDPVREREADPGREHGNERESDRVVEGQDRQPGGREKRRAGDQQDRAEAALRELAAPSQAAAETPNDEAERTRGCRGEPVVDAQVMDEPGAEDQRH